MKSSASSVSAICTFLNSISSVELKTGMSGQADISLVIHSGPFHHSVRVERVVGSAPREMRSAGLCAVGTCRQMTDEVSVDRVGCRLCCSVCRLCCLTARFA